MMRMRYLGAALILTLACGDAAPESQQATQRDSAGVTIVEHAGDLWSAPLHWRTSAEPVMRVGAVEGDEAYLFDGIAAVVPLRDGRFVVANRGDQSMRWFDAAGQFLFERGGPGEGPGEFSSVGPLTLIGGDTIVAVDPSGRRFILFGSDGTLGRTTRIEGLTAPPGRVHRISSGEWILGTVGFSSTQLGRNIVSGIHRPASPILHVASDGARVDTIGMFPGAEIQVTTMGDGFRMSPTPLSRRMSYTVVGDELIVGTAERLRFDVYSPAGTHVRSVRAPDVDVSLTPAIEAAYMTRIEEILEQLPESQRADTRRAMMGTGLPDVVPAYASLLADDDGNVWLNAYRIGTSTPQHALAFDAAGLFLGRAELPPSLRVMAVQDGFVWGRETDELGVEYIVKYALEAQ